jgi:uncharacterized protein (DUF983 family)
MRAFAGARRLLGTLGRMSICPKCATEMNPGIQQCQVCGAYLEQATSDLETPTPTHINLVKHGMVLVTAAAIAFILQTFAPSEIRISLWLADVPLWTLVLLAYLGGAVGAILIAVGYASRLFLR